MRREVINRIKTGITLLILCAGFTLIFHLSHKGLDFTDEGKYLLDSKHPDSSVGLITHYGYVYHYLFSLVNYDVGLFRFLNFLITFGVAATTTSFILKYLNLVQRQFSFLSFNLAIISGIVSLTYFSVYWLPTPSYNSLTFQSMMICLMAISKCFYPIKSQITSYTLIITSFSFALLFLAKPPAFLILILISSLILKITNRINYKNYCYFLALILSWLFLFSYLIYRNIFGIFQSATEGIRNAQRLTATYSAESQLTLDLPPKSIWLAFFCGLTVLLVFYGGNKYSRIADIKAWVLILVLAILFFIVIHFQDQIFETFGNSFLIFITFLFISLAIDKVDCQSLIGVNKLVWVIPILPFVCAFGTNNNIWIHASMNFYFFYLFGLFFLLHFKPRFFLDQPSYLFLILVMLMSFCSITSIIDRPYRQISPLSANNVQLTQPNELNGIQVTEDVALRIRQMLSEMKFAGFESGTPMIDFSGQSPTSVFIAEAVPAGDSWLIGGYEGSNAFAIEKLSEMNCRKLNTSWLLIEVGGPRSLNHQLVLNRLGLDFNSYRKVAAWQTPKGAGGYEFSREQSLYKPPNNLEVCESDSKN
jgi:hypothetical protein